MNTNIWYRELLEVLRGIAGGFLFGIPLLYTMEVWQLSVVLEPWRVLVYLLVGLLLNVVLERLSGFRREVTWADNFAGAVEAVGLGIIAATLTMFAIGRIRLDTPILIAADIIAFEAIPFSVGVSVANSLLRRGEEDDEADSGDGEPTTKGIVRDLAATGLGAAMISVSIAPTDEVPMVATALLPWQIVVLILFTLGVTYLIVFRTEFLGSRAHRSSPFRHPYTETAFSYVVALSVALVLLVLFGRLNLGDPWWQIYSQTIVLGLPAAVGGAAGRLVA